MSRNSRVVQLVSPRESYPLDSEILRDADVVIDMHGMILKHRDGLANVPATPELINQAWQLRP